MNLGPTTAYKLFKVRKDGSIGPLFINARARLPVGKWLPAEHTHRVKGFAYRPGWHATLKPEAPHLGTKGRRWFVVEVEDFKTYARPESQGGTWVLAERMRIVRPLQSEAVCG